MKVRFPELKQALKNKAKEIRTLKSKRKSSSFGFVPGLARSQREYRRVHIIYCMANGTPYEAIEKPSRALPLDIDQMLLEAKALREEYDEAVRTSLQQAI